MNNGKLENLLNVALNVTDEERMKSPDLETGYNPDNRTWELIVRYNQNIDILKEELPEVLVTPLLGRYAILQVPQGLIDAVSQKSYIEYIEKPKRLYYELYNELLASCITSVQRGSGGSGLSGAGTIVAIIDTGIDVLDNDFRDVDGSTRIVSILDQTLGNREFSQNEINEYLIDGRGRFASTDVVGHGTNVAKIACGNRGVATKADIMAVKLGLSEADSFPRTTQIMSAIDYVVKKAEQLNRPVAINLSIGNNYGNHSGTSLLETYINAAADYSINSICIGAGNESASAIHTGGVVRSGEETVVEVSVREYESSLNIQIWKNYKDVFRIILTAPDGRTVISVITSGETVSQSQTEVIQTAFYRETKILTYVGVPNPYNLMQEIYIDMLPQNAFINGGQWKITLVPEYVVNGEYNMWLPASASLNPGTGFANPNSSLTITVPATAAKAVTVGAYDSYSGAVAAFSGRGYVANLGAGLLVKPEIVAPGVNVQVTDNNRVTGTSFATPFVTGAAALLMEWGIVRGNDMFLYGEKLKAYLISGARPLPGRSYAGPNPVTGDCVKLVLG